MTLRDRCTAFLAPLMGDTLTEQDADDMADFVRSEIGRAASEKLDETEPLVLYFSTPADREEMVAALHAAKPGMIAKRWPR